MFLFPIKGHPIAINLAALRLHCITLPPQGGDDENRIFEDPDCSISTGNRELVWATADQGFTGNLRQIPAPFRCHASLWYHHYEAH